MSGYAANNKVLLKSLHAVLLMFQNLVHIGNYNCPVVAPIDTITSIGSFDDIIVGAGSAGSVLAYRLAQSNAKVLILEEGECTPLESHVAGYMAFLPKSTVDYAMDINDDGYSCQNQDHKDAAIAGKMFGGTGSLSYMIYDTPNKGDYDSWGDAANDSSWNYQGLLPYFVKAETVQDQTLLVQNTSWHGITGPTLLMKQKDTPMSDLMINAHKDIGKTFKNDSDGISVFKPWLAVGKNVRQTGDITYLGRAKNFTNAYFLSHAVVNKIHFKGTTATGVKFTHGGITYNVTAKKNVIISAGALKTPQLLMLSGVGDANALSSFDIKSVIDNCEVGKNLIDAVGSVTSYAINRTTVLPPSDPHNYPFPVVVNVDSLNSSQVQMQKNDINAYFVKNSSVFLHICTFGFKYSNAFCDHWHKSNINNDMITIISTFPHLASNGSVTLKTKHIKDSPSITLNLLSESTDLDKFAELMVQYGEPLLESASFKGVNATFVDLNICNDHTKFSLDFWKCYILATSITRWQYSGTCSVGKVVDSKFNLIGAKGIKIVDASVIPGTLSGNIESTIHALAEKAADIIIKESA